MTFNRLVNEYLDHISGCDEFEDDFDTTYIAELKSRNIFRSIIIQVNDHYSEVIELSNIPDASDSFNKRVAWFSEYNGYEKDTTTILDRKFLEKELKEIDSRIRHYGDRVCVWL